MTSDFERKPNPYGTTGGTTGQPAEITVGGTSSGAAQSGFGNNTSIHEASTASGQRAGSATPGSDADRAKGVIDRETGAAKAELGNAAREIKDGAASLAATAREKASESVEAGKSQLTSSLGDFAAAVRKASDELGERDQSMAAGLVREVANGLEQATGSIEGRSVQDLTRSVASFARRQPTTFLIGAALAGIALGRFARASGDHAATPGDGPRGYGDDDRYGSAYDRNRGRESMTPGRSAASSAGSSSASSGLQASTASRPVTPPVSAGTSAPRTSSTADTPVSYANPARPSSAGASAGSSISGGSLSTGATASGTAPAEGPSGAALGHGSGSFNPQGGRDDR
ncbi:hypothetical protein ASG43_16165 [Aureimonas sp. Leaf454]|uniref:hypothetical protein n=1 Tax=Aureimonas sp. Leaf454 TaxID=1736381 RepID=UPI0006FEE823|nr:hypothetical protein [Aureimonas sp. Leaf454]KQT43058.1 hypothetical protein ASG43_16165 [Aureimonas sp. Leaf454]